LGAQEVFVRREDISVVLSHLRPSRGVCEHLSRLPFFDAKSSDVPRRIVSFTAVHLRWLEGSCLSRASRSGDTAEADNVCHMRIAFVNKWRLSIGLEFSPLVVVADGESSNDLQELMDHGAMHLHGLQSSIVAVGIDFWLLVYATETLGSFVSTFSLNACSVRQSWNFSSCTFHVSSDAKNLQRAQHLNESFELI
jgi:hypothetical protein